MSSVVVSRGSSVVHNSSRLVAHTNYVVMKWIFADEMKGIFVYRTVCNQLKPSRDWIELASTNDPPMLNLYDPLFNRVNRAGEPLKTDLDSLVSVHTFTWQMSRVCEVEN